MKRLAGAEAPRSKGAVVMLLLHLLPVLCSGFLHGAAVDPRSIRSSYAAKMLLNVHRCTGVERRLNAVRYRSMSSDANDNDDRDSDSSSPVAGPRSDDDLLFTLWRSIQEQTSMWRKLPPFRVEDTSLLYYDVFLIVNLVLSISFWVTHRMDVRYLPAALSEGSLLSLLWIAAGLYTGAFLQSAKDGHYGASDDRAGPKAAALLGFMTFLNAVNLRLCFALVLAFVQHRPVGLTPAEELVPLEIGFGLILMSVFRFIHSSMTPRI